MARLPDPAVRECWEDRLRSFERSGLSVVDFCRREGVSTPSFYQWRKKICRHVQARGSAARDSSDRTGFVPLVVDSAPESFRIRFSNRAVVEIPTCEASTLLRAVAQLAAADDAGESQP